MRVSALARITRERGNLNETGYVRTERSPVHRPFRCRSLPPFFKRAPVVRIERGTFFGRLPYDFLSQNPDVKMQCISNTQAATHETLFSSSLNFHLLSRVQLYPSPCFFDYTLQWWHDRELFLIHAMSLLLSLVSIRYK